MRLAVQQVLTNKLLCYRAVSATALRVTRYKPWLCWWP